MLDRYLDKLELANRDIRLFRKIMKLMPEIPYPGELKILIKTSVAFSNPGGGMDYFRRLYYATCHERQEAAELGRIQSEYDVVFVVAGTNIPKGETKKI